MRISISDVRSNFISIQLNKTGISIAQIAILIIFSPGLRLLIALLGWPHANTDEGVIGEMAYNIAYHREFPLFFYGQEYMGPLQAYLAAPLFWLSGPTLFNLYVMTTFLYTIFLVAMYILIRLLTSHRFALLNTLLFSLANELIVYREMQAIGGYPDTLAFGSLLFLITAWLLFTMMAPEKNTHGHFYKKRLLLYLCWGCIAGIALWDDSLILPFLLCSGLIIGLCCWLEGKYITLLGVFLGMCCGAGPLIIYNLSALPGHDSLSVLQKVSDLHISTSLLTSLPASLLSTFFVGLPVATGYPRTCSYTNTFLLGGTGLTAIQCAVQQGGWSLIVVGLWILAFWQIICTFVKKGKSKQYTLLIQHFKQSLYFSKEAKRNVIFLSLLCAIALSVCLYAISPTASREPYLNARYLLPIVLGTPILLYPIYREIKYPKMWKLQASGIKSLTCLIFLAVVIFAHIQGMIYVWQGIPHDRLMTENLGMVINKLEALHIKHVNTDTATCNPLIFLSQTHILCNEVDQNMKSKGTRYSSYGKIVQADSGASYLFPQKSVSAIQCPLFLSKHNKSFQEIRINEYILYKIT